MTKVLQLDCSFGGDGVTADLGSPTADVWVTFEVALSVNALTWLNGQAFAQLFATIYDTTEAANANLAFMPAPASGFEWGDSNTAFGDFALTLAALQFYQVEMRCFAAAPMGLQVFIDGTDLGTLTTSVNATGFQHYKLGAISGGLASAGSYVYIDNYKVGTSRGASDLFSDDFEGSLPGNWNEFYQPLCASIVDDPGIAPPRVAFVPYATTDELFRVLKVRTPTSDQVLAAQGDIDTATIEINSEINWPDDHAAATAQELELLRGVCLDRAADLWRHRESAPGILGVVDEAVPSTFGRYSWERYAQRLAPLKEQWGIA